MLRTLAVVVGASGILAACSSGAAPAPSSSAGSSSSPVVVDGITVPPIYQPPPVTVVPGPSTCPASLASSLAAAGHGTYTLQAEHESHLLTCRYADAQAAATDCSAATVRINTQPQAFQAFNRWNVETGQNSMWANKPDLQPVPLSGIGVVAEWVPALHELGAASATTWVSVVVSCPTPAHDVPPVARDLARAGLAATQ